MRYIKLVVLITLVFTIGFKSFSQTKEPPKAAPTVPPVASPQKGATVPAAGQKPATLTAKPKATVKNNTDAEEKRKRVSAVKPANPYLNNKNYYPNGQIKEKGDSTSGMREGEWKSFDRNGKVIARYIYVKNVKEGECELYYENGQVKEKGKMMNGKYEGEITYYFQNGKDAAKKNYANGIEEGEFTWFFENGSLKKKVKYVNGKLDGDYLENHENGQAKVQATYLNGKLQGDYTSFFPSGAEKRKGNYLGGKKDGEWFTYYEDGQVKYKQRFNMGKTR